MTTTIEVLELLYAKFDKEYQNPATIDLSIDYLEGRCDAIDMAIQAIELRDLLEKPPLERKDVCEEWRGFDAPI